MKLLSTQQVKSIQDDKFCLIKEILRQRSLSVEEYAKRLRKELLSERTIRIVRVRVVRTIRIDHNVWEIDLFKKGFTWSFLDVTIRYCWFDDKLVGVPEQVLYEIFSRPLKEFYEELLLETGFRRVESSSKEAIKGVNEADLRTLSEWVRQ